jgi:hypothetical protein
MRLRVTSTRNSVTAFGQPLIAVATAVSLVVLVLWLLPLALVDSLSGSFNDADRLRAAHDVRSSIVAFLVAAGAGGTLLFTARSYSLSREGHVTDRFTKAVGHLGDSNPSVRIGGIYALERIARDSSRDRTAIVYLLGSFIRERSKARTIGDDAPEDLRAALRAVGRVLRMSDEILDLRHTDLRQRDLSMIEPDRVLLDETRLEGAIRPGGQGAEALPLPRGRASTDGYFARRK